VTEGILSAIGHAPLVNLTRVLADSPARRCAKPEGFNPGGSAKDRPRNIDYLWQDEAEVEIEPWKTATSQS